MKFTPSLQRVLQLRRSLERQEEMKLARLTAQRQAIASAEESNRTRARSEQSSLLRDLTNEVTGAELQYAGLRHEMETDRAAHLRRQAAIAEQAQAEQRAALLTRTRERETLDTLASQSQTAERRDRQRREQAALDESFLLRNAAQRPHEH